MNYTDFAENFLIVLYQESDKGSPEQRLGDLIKKYGLPENVRWLERLTEEWEKNAYANVDAFIGSPLNWIAEISAPGLRYVEKKYGSKDGVGEIIAPLPVPPPGEEFLTDENGEPLEFGDGDYLTMSVENDSSQDPVTHSSSRWTGLSPDFKLDEEKGAKLIALLSVADRSLDQIGAGNLEKAMARAYIVAAKSLADAPEPPADLIWEIVNRANQLSGVASLFVSIIALFMAGH